MTSRSPVDDRRWPRGPRRTVDVDTLDQFDALVASGADSMARWRLQDLDLTGRGPELRRLQARGALFLGCELTPADEASLRARGALLFPDVPDVPFDPYRATLYSPDELYSGLDDGYAHTADARIYAWSRQRSSGEPGVAAALAATLHDHAIDEALGEHLSGRRVVGVMGGHAQRRGTPAYADAVRLGRALAGAGLLVGTGGGPGAMEGANLGVRCAALADRDLDEVLKRIGRVPDFRPSVTDWARAAFDVAADLPDGDGGIGIPTWFYGQEPPHVFATGVAKYFRNAIREDTLLQVCNAGIVFLPGAAGTVQEIFQDACENYYAEPGARAPMVLVGREHWTVTLPAWPLVRQMAAERGFEQEVHLVDAWDEVMPLLSG
jgi:predicted Rossmann-fold nucleotide-binding protein